MASAAAAIARQQQQRSSARHGSTQAQGPPAFGAGEVEGAERRAENKYGRQKSLGLFRSARRKASIFPTSNGTSSRPTAGEEKLEGNELAERLEWEMLARKKMEEKENEIV